MSANPNVLGILFCGGRGKRLGEITRFVSKAFVPVYDRPVFRYGLQALERSSHIDEIAILSNDENDEKLRKLGYRTLTQDDGAVHDMFTGMGFVRRFVRPKEAFVLMPCDNVSDVAVDPTVETFRQNEADIAFNVYRVADRAKLREMGVIDKEANRVCEKPRHPPSEWGIIAPFVVRADLDVHTHPSDEVINRCRFTHREHCGFWFDVGDPPSLAAANEFVARQARKGNAQCLPSESRRP